MRKNRSRGSYNETKTKVLVYLAARKDSGDSHPVGLSALCKATGANYSYLKTRLLVWANWGYLHAHLIAPHKGRPYYGYSLAADGRAYLTHQSNRRIHRAHQSIFESGPAGSSLGSIPQAGDWFRGIAADGQDHSSLQGIRPSGSYFQDIADSAGDDNPGEDDIDMDEIFGEG